MLWQLGAIPDLKGRDRGGSGSCELAGVVRNGVGPRGRRRLQCLRAARDVT
jgi:hypothetical protein